MDFLVSITNIGLNQALIQKEVNDEKVLDIIWSIGFLRGLFLAAVLFFLSHFIASLFNEPRVEGILQVLAFKPLIEELSSIKVVYLIKELKLKSFASIKIAESLISTLIAIFLAPAFGIWALVIGILAGSVTYLIFSYIFAPYIPKFDLTIRAIKSFISFGMWIFISGFIAVSSNVIIQIIITRNLGTTALGLYYLASKLAFVAYEVSSEVIGTVAFSVYSKIQKDLEKVYSAWNIIIRGVILIYFPMICLLIGLSPYLIDYVLGSKWLGTERLIQLLAVSGVFLVFAETTIPVLKGLGRPDRVMLIELIQYSLLIPSIYFLSKLFGINGAATGWIFAGIGSSILSVIFLKNMKINPFHANTIFFLTIILSSVAGTIISLLTLKIFPDIIGFFFAVILGTGTIVLLIWLANSKFDLRINEIIGKIFPSLNFKSLIKIN